MTSFHSTGIAGQQDPLPQPRTIKPNWVQLLSLDEYISPLSGLEDSTKYYVRAYATNEKGTAYATNSYGTAYGTVIPFVAGDPALDFIGDPNLVAYFPFNNNADDESGYGDDGVVSGALITVDRFGNASSAYTFDGVNDNITCGNGYRNITSTVSISVWVKTSTEVGHIVSKYDAKVDKGWFISFNSGGNLGLYGRNTGGEFARAETSLKFNDNQWHNLIGIIDSNSFKLWVDGNLVGEDELYAANPDLTNNDQLGIGHWALGDLGEHMYYEGIIDDVLIFNRVLTPEEITFLAGAKR